MSAKVRGVPYLFSKAHLRVMDSLPRSIAQMIHGTADLLKTGFPKSGNNWVHFLLANAIVRSAGRNDEISFRNNDEWVSTSVPREPPVDGYPRLLSNTLPYGEQTYLDEDTSVIYIVRHPGDVMESYYHYRAGRWNDDVGEFSDFIRSDRFGLGNWVDHVASWDGHYDLLVKFEELKQEPHTVLEGIAALLHRDFGDDTVKQAVKAASFKNMARMEEKYGLPEKHGANPEFTFMRKGESNRGAEYFTDDDYRYLDRIAGDWMHHFGYDVPE